MQTLGTKSRIVNVLIRDVISRLGALINIPTFHRPPELINREIINVFSETNDSEPMHTFSSRANHTLLKREG